MRSALLIPSGLHADKSTLGLMVLFFLQAAASLANADAAARKLKIHWVMKDHNLNLYTGVPHVASHPSCGMACQAAFGHPRLLLITLTLNLSLKCEGYAAFPTTLPFCANPRLVSRI